MRIAEMAAVAGETASPTNEAAEWFVRLQDEELSVEQISHWQQWLAASEENRQAFERIEELWAKFERLPNKLPPPLPPERWWQTPRHLAAAAAMVALAVGVAAVLGWQAWRNTGWDASTGALAQTRTGEHRDVKLPDGSRVALGARSVAKIRFAVDEREVRLESGEAFFDVEKDARRPFVVRVGETTITAIGTAFNVRRAGDRTHVTVTEGAVRVDAPGMASDSPPITAGHQFTVDPSLTRSAVRAASVESATAWQSGRLEYLGEPLKYVIDDVNRYAHRRIVIGDAEVGELRLTGTVFENDIESWLRSVEDLLPVKAERSGDGEVVLRRREP